MSPVYSLLCMGMCARTRMRSRTHMHALHNQVLLVYFLLPNLFIARHMSPRHNEAWFTFAVIFDAFGLES